MTFPASFYRVAALASIASAITTLLLIFLPEWMAPAPDFAARMARVNDPLQPLARTLIGVWLWRNADESRPLR